MITGTALMVAATITADEARALTDRIRALADHLCALLLEAYDRKAWAALGYSSYEAYVKAEFSIGRSHAYRLLDQGRVIQAVSAAARSPIGETISEHQARVLKPHLVAVTSEIRERIDRGEVAISVVPTVIAERTKYYLGSRKQADRPNRFLATLALELRAIWLEQDLTADLAPESLDPSLVEEWADTFREAAKRINRLAAALERHHRKAGAA